MGGGIKPLAKDGFIGDNIMYEYIGYFHQTEDGIQVRNSGFDGWAVGDRVTEVPISKYPLAFIEVEEQPIGFY